MTVGKETSQYSELGERCNCIGNYDPCTVFVSLTTSKPKPFALVVLPGRSTAFWSAVTPEWPQRIGLYRAFPKQEMACDHLARACFDSALMAACGEGSGDGTSGTSGGGGSGGGTGPYATTTTITTSNATVAAGSSLAFSAKVSGQGGQGNPAGQVIFYASDCGQIGTANLASGTATLTSLRKAQAFIRSPRNGGDYMGTTQ